MTPQQIEALKLALEALKAMAEDLKKPDFQMMATMVVLGKVAEQMLTPTAE